MTVRTWLVKHARLLLVLALLALLVVAVRATGLADNFQPSALQQTIAGHRGSGLLIYVALFVLGNLLQIPGWVFLAAAVYAFGAVWGGLATYLAANLSCAVTFGVIRAAGGDALRELRYAWAQKVFRQIDTAPVRTVVVLRLVFATMPVLNASLALSGVALRDYLLGSALGLVLPVAAYVVFLEEIGMLLGWH